MKFLSILFSLGLAFLVSNPSYSAEPILFDCAKIQKKLQTHLGKRYSSTSSSIYIDFLSRKQGCKNQNHIFESHGGDALVPASTVKIVTSIAALDILKPNKKFKTKVFAEGKVKDGILYGNLVVWGNGDPYLVSERLWLLVRQIALSGIKKVSGGILINDKFFGKGNDDLMNWGEDDTAYIGVLSAVSLNFNRAEINLAVSADQTKVLAEMGPLPNDYANIRNNIKLVEGRKKNISVVRQADEKGKEVFLLVGELGKERKRATVYKSVIDPAKHFGKVLKAMMQQQGIEVSGDYLGITASKHGTEIADLDSLPLIDLIRLMNTYSNNFMAEQIYRAIGAEKYNEPATSEKSSQATSEFLKAYEYCTNNTVENGSGLSWTTKLSARCLVQIMQKSFVDFRQFADLLGSLPIAQSTGTLKDRFNFVDEIDPLKIRAKTGTLWSKKAVTALAGFLANEDGQILVYAILNNDSTAGYQRAMKLRRWEDQAISLLQNVAF